MEEDGRIEKKKDGIAVKEEISELVTLDLTVHPQEFKNYLIEQELPKTTSFAKYQRNAAACKELRNKLRSMVQERSTDVEEAFRIHHKIQTCLKIESEKAAINDLIKMNRQCSQLRRAFMNRGLPVDKETILSAAASKDTFDMSSLSASLPSTSNESDDDLLNKTKKLTQDFLAIVKMQRLLLKRPERDSVPASIDSELNNNIASCSHKPRQPISLTQMVKNICGDRKSMSHLSLRAMTRIQKVPDGSSSSSMSISSWRPMLTKGPDGSSHSYLSYSLVRPTMRKVPNGSSNSSMFYTPVRPMLRKVPDGSSNSNMSYSSLRPSTRIPKDLDCSSNSSISISPESVSLPEVSDIYAWLRKTEKCAVDTKVSNNPTLSAEPRFKTHEEVVPKYCSLLKSCARRRYFLAQHLKQLRDSTSLERQMSRLNITNSRRADLKEAEAESETAVSSSDQIKEEQEEAARENRRKVIKMKLKKLLLQYREAKGAEKKENSQEM